MFSIKPMFTKRALPFWVVGVIVMLPTIAGCILCIINGYAAHGVLFKKTMNYVVLENETYSILIRLWVYGSYTYYILIPTYFILCRKKFQDLLMPFLSVTLGFPVLFVILMYPVFFPAAFLSKHGNYTGILVEYISASIIYLTVTYTIIFLLKVVRRKIKR